MAQNIFWILAIISMSILIIANIYNLKTAKLHKKYIERELEALNIKITSEMLKNLFGKNESEEK